MTDGTLKGVIVGSGKKKTPQYNVLIKKLVLYCGEQGYRYLLEVILTLKDKPPDDIDFNEPVPDSDQWIVDTFVPIRNGDGSVVIVDGKVQKEKQMVENELKSKLGMAKWLKKYKAKMLTNQVIEHSEAAYKDNVRIFFESLKSQTGKFPFGIASLLTIIKKQPDGEGTKPSDVMNWKDITSNQA